MKKHTRWMVALLAVTLFFAAACSDDDDETSTGGGGTSTTEAGSEAAAKEGPTIVIGAQDFGESAILAEIYGQGLAAQGYSVEQQTLGGFRDIQMAAFESGDINFAPEYAASMLEFLNDKAGEATGDVDETVTALQGYLDELGLVALTPAPGVDTNGFVVTQETADELGLATLSDLAANGSDLTLGAPADCETNPFCLPGLQEVYGLDLSGSFVGLDTGVVATALENGEVDVAVLFTTDGRISEKGFVLLEDDQGMLAADNIVPVTTTEVADAYGQEMVDLVDSISAKLDTATLTALNKRYDIDKESAEDIAQAWLQENGFL
ncbi:MAG: ABC transporter substrate-binding protein [Acidimicrobiales bacterium]|jgi:osmoprotectant transport system substrate-binding protein|nr:ABC transporter substrate-binding protein [Acidimicrobiales bacterium]